MTQDTDTKSTSEEAAQDEAFLAVIQEKVSQAWQENAHYYIKIIVSVALCALLLCVGAPIFVMGRMTGSLSYTALGLVLVAFALILAVAALVLAFHPPWKRK